MGMTGSSFGKYDFSEEESSITQQSSDSVMPCNADTT